VRNDGSRILPKTALRADCAETALWQVGESNFEKRPGAGQQLLSAVNRKLSR